MLGLIPRVPEKNFRGKIIDVAEVNQQHWIEERGQWLENVDRTHLVLSSGKPVLQKKILQKAVLTEHAKQLRTCTLECTHGQVAGDLHGW